MDVSWRSRCCSRDRAHLGAAGSNTVRIFVLVGVIGGFSWPYIGRIVRGQTLSLREREFRRVGPQHRCEAVPHPRQGAPAEPSGADLVYATLTIPANILFEAALSYLGVGVQAPQPSWGHLLSDAQNFYQYDPMYMVIPAPRSS